MKRYGFLAAIVVALFAAHIEASLVLAVLLAAWLATGGHHTCYLAYHTLGRDLRAANFMIRLLLLVKKSQWQNLTVPKMFKQTVLRSPEKVMIYFEDEVWTFRQVDEYSNRIANYFLSLGFIKGDVVALFMENRPEYVAIWLGLAKAGIIPALINFNLKQTSLVHAIRVANSKAIIFGVELAEEMREIMPELKCESGQEFSAFASGSKKSLASPSGFLGVCLDQELERTSHEDVPIQVQNKIGFKDRLLYIFTSGTSGLPKCVVIKQSRFLLASMVPVHLAGLRPEDILYDPLPLYHSSAGMLAVGPSFLSGVTVALRTKFSASNFWKDCIKYNCTVRFLRETSYSSLGPRVILTACTFLIYCCLCVIYLVLPFRYILASGGCTTVIGCRPNDIIYSPLPLYHSVAGMIALAGTMKHGISMVIRRKFSVSSYWSDCMKYGVTAAQYIGEICRYLLNTEECPEEKKHRVRLMFGNGLRRSIWADFTERFNIQNIAEFYGSTEGNSNIINYENRVGAVGFISVLFPGLLPMGLIKVNEETGEELRDENGFCISCKPGEPGEFVGKIVKNHPVRDFDGYTDQAATRKKIVSNVWSNGDVCFRSGDLLVMDEFGWLYFKDRCGDTFRWRGENVSTTEVENTMGHMVHLKDVIVYGVEIPGTEGKAGMAAIHDPEQDVDLVRLADGVKQHLPGFARPLFVRLIKHLDITGTFKLRKINLQREGFDPSLISDKLFFLHPSSGSYEALSVELFNKIVTGAIRL